MIAERISILIVDDHPVVRRGTRAFLEENDGFVCCADASDGLEAVTQYFEKRPDIVLMDLKMPKLDGVEATRQIISRDPHAKILVLTSFLGDVNIVPAINAGALGYLLKDSTPDDIVAAIRRVHQGELTLAPKIAEHILKELDDPREFHHAPNLLTSRETEVLQLLASGKSNTEIAEELVIAEVTVRTHISRILEKLHLSNRVQATLFALREGISTLDLND